MSYEIFTFEWESVPFEYCTVPVRLHSRAPRYIHQSIVSNQIHFYMSFQPHDSFLQKLSPQLIELSIFLQVTTQ